MAPIKLLIGDDHGMFLKGLVSLFGTLPDFKVVGQAVNGADVVDLARVLQPDLILLDLRMPVLTGVQALRLIRAERPEAIVVLLTASDDERDIMDAMAAGARGYLLKTCEPDDLVEQLREAMAGKVVINGSIPSEQRKHALERAKS
jgi:DNA-binding NarL/FixJ family response regulator